jgi:WD40 repeat protein
MRALKGHSAEVRAVAYSLDGRLVSGGNDKTVRIWNVATGECGTIIKAKGPVYAVAVAPDGKTIAYAGRHAPRAESNFVYLCDWAGTSTGRHELRRQDYIWERGARGALRRVLRWVPRSIWSLSFSADGRYLVAACRVPGGANIPDGGGGHCWKRVKAGTDFPLAGDDIYAAAFALSGHRLAVTRKNVVEFLTEPGGQLGTSYPLTVSWSPTVAFVPGADLAVVAAAAFVYFVNPVRQEKPTRLKTGIRIVTGIAASPDGKTVLVGGKPGTIEVYDTTTRTKTTTYDFGIGGVHAMAYAPDGLTFAAAGDTGLVVCDVG